MPKKIKQDPYLAACELLGITPTPELLDKSNKDEVSIDAYRRLIICIRAKNRVGDKVWEPVYDGSEAHYWPYFRKNSAGFGFSYAGYVDWYTITGVGSRLEYRTRALAEQGAKEFDKYYQDYLN